jgi:hypothetical protein
VTVLEDSFQQVAILVTHANLRLVNYNIEQAYSALGQCSTPQWPASCRGQADSDLGSGLLVLFKHGSVHFFFFSGRLRVRVHQHAVDIGLRLEP